MRRDEEERRKQGCEGGTMGMGDGSGGKRGQWGEGRWN